MVIMVLFLLSLSRNGDLLLLIGRMLRLRGLDTVRVTKVKGHADEGMVLNGRVREVDRFGNNAADEAADFGRGRLVVEAGTLLFLTFIGFSLLFLELWSIMMVGWYCS